MTDQSVQDRLDDLESLVKQQQETIEQQRRRMDELESTDESDQSLPVSRRSALTAGGTLALLGLGTGKTGAAGTGTIGTDTNPLEAVVTESIRGGVAEGNEIVSLIGSGLSVDGENKLTAAGASKWDTDEDEDLLEPSDAAINGIRLDEEIRSEDFLEFNLDVYTTTQTKLEIDEVEGVTANDDLTVDGDVDWTGALLGATDWDDLDIDESDVEPADVGLASLSTGNGLTGTAYDGTAAVDDWQVDGNRYLEVDAAGVNFTGPAEWENAGDTGANTINNDSNAAVLAGADNEANGIHTVVCGGRMNEALDSQTAIGGGLNNKAEGISATVGGGHINEATGAHSTVAGGKANLADGGHATICGGGSVDTTVGAGNHAAGEFSFIGGGEENVANDAHATVGGGESNNVSGEHTVIGGGRDNTVNSDDVTVSGGSSNTVDGFRGAIAGGHNNSIEDASPSSCIGGGIGNSIDAAAATIGGGSGNEVTGHRATVSGGRNNKASSDPATVGGGQENVAEGAASTIAGGSGNSIHEFASASAIGGGNGNQADGTTSIIPGGRDNTTTSVASFSFAAGREATAQHAGTFVFGDSSETEILTKQEGEARFQVSVATEVGSIYQPGVEPTTEELPNGEGMIWVSDGSSFGGTFDLIYSVNDGGTIESTIIESDPT